MDDSPKQDPLDKSELESTILSLVPAQSFDLIITHNPHGEYTRHIRHEEVSKAVFELWFANQIQTPALWTFAYTDGGEVFYPRPMENANHHVMLSDKIWEKKYRLITETYGFEKNSWEANTCPKSEAFAQYKKWSQIEEDLKTNTA
jgi:LmbE family N-acetylglucosaminyl deacetylase